MAAHRIPDAVSYIGLTFDQFPILALTFTHFPPHYGDTPADFYRKNDYEQSPEKSFGAATQIGVGLLGINMPRTGTAPRSNQHIYGLRVVNFPIAAVVVKDISENAMQSAHKAVALGLLGMKIPLKR